MNKPLHNNTTAPNTTACMLARCLDKLYFICACLSGVFLCALFALVLWSILARLLGVFSSGTTNFAGYFMAASTFLALAYTFRQQAHIRVELLISKIKSPWLNRVCLCLMAIACLYLAFYMGKLCVDAFIYEERSEGADALLLWIPQSVAAFGASVFAISVIHSMIESFVKTKPHQRLQSTNN